jgi:hypothetical protein
MLRLTSFSRLVPDGEDDAVGKRLADEFALKLNGASAGSSGAAIIERIFGDVIVAARPKSLSDLLAASDERKQQDKREKKGTRDFHHQVQR